MKNVRTRTHTHTHMMLLCGELVILQEYVVEVIWSEKFCLNHR